MLVDCIVGYKTLSNGATQVQTVNIFDLSTQTRAPSLGKNNDCLLCMSVKQQLLIGEKPSHDPPKNCFFPKKLDF